MHSSLTTDALRFTQQSIIKSDGLTQHELFVTVKSKTLSQQTQRIWQHFQMNKHYGR